MTNTEIFLLNEKLNVVDKIKIGLPIEINSAIRKNRRAVAALAKDYEEMRNDLIKKYGTEDENGQVRVELNNKEFMEEFNKLNAMENDISFVKFSESLIPNGLTPEEYNILADMAE